jgi:hypothetical protein
MRLVITLSAERGGQRGSKGHMKLAIACFSLPIYELAGSLRSLTIHHLVTTGPTEVFTGLTQLAPMFLRTQNSCISCAVVI